eukprot:COSAG06_NODE_37778_length_431_cov_0.822289_1_plen_43_part_10
MMLFDLSTELHNMKEDGRAQKKDTRVQRWQLLCQSCSTTAAQV